MLSRRRFLKLSSAGALGACLTKLPRIPSHPTPTPEPIIIGRTVDYVGMFDAPSYAAEKIGAFGAEELIPIYEVVEGQGSYNRTWYRCEEGYIYSSNVVPMEPYTAPPPLVTHLSTWGAWAEVVAPWSDSRTAPRHDADFMYRLYYSSVHHIVKTRRSDTGAWWYQIDDPRYGEFYWAEAAHLRVLGPRAFAPIHPDAEDKSIEISLEAHILTAYEGDTPVLQTTISSGETFFWKDDTTDYFETPAGGYRVLLKAPARHMGSSGTLGRFDYPGVPWCTFFTDDGLAIHGTYWHNDFGCKRSHGCINMRPAEALWIFRWTVPEMPYEAEWMGTGHMTTTPIYIY